MHLLNYGNVASRDCREKLTETIPENVKLKNKIHVFIIGKRDANKKSFFPCMNSFCYGKIILSELFFITSPEDINHQSTINHVAIEYHAWFSLIQPFSNSI